MRIESGVENEAREFFTDLNGFQVSVNEALATFGERHATIFSLGHSLVDVTCIVRFHLWLIFGYFSLHRLLVSR